MIKLLDRIKRRVWCLYRHDWRDRRYGLTARQLRRHGIESTHSWQRRACVSCNAGWPAPGGKCS